MDTSLFGARQAQACCLHIEFHVACMHGVRRIVSAQTRAVPVSLGKFCSSNNSATNTCCYKHEHCMGSGQRLPAPTCTRKPFESLKLLQPDVKPTLFRMKRPKPKEAIPEVLVERVRVDALRAQLEPRPLRLALLEARRQQQEDAQQAVRLDRALPP